MIFLYGYSDARSNTRPLPEPKSIKVLAEWSIGRLFKIERAALTGVGS